jgi:hypothetical protein
MVYRALFAYLIAALLFSRFWRQKSTFEHQKHLVFGICDLHSAQPFGKFMEPLTAEWRNQMNGSKQSRG